MDYQKTHKSESLAFKYFTGGYYNEWVTLLPESYIPYLQLTRLNIAAPLALVYFPHLLGVLHAVATDKSQHHSPLDVFYVSTLLFGGSIFYSNAGHAWDDLIDAPLDVQMDRTKNRPIPRGAISKKAAVVFTVASSIGAASFLLLLPAVTACTTIPSILSVAYYPMAKRHTSVPQVILGFSLAWGIMVGKSSVIGDQWPWYDRSAVCLVVAYTFTMVIYDTIYAYQDIADDVKLGVGSTAVLFRNHMKLALSLLTICMAISLYISGILAGLGVMYLTVAVGGSVFSVALMLYKVDLKDRINCWYWFSTGFWSTMLSLTAGLLLEYLIVEISIES